MIKILIDLIQFLYSTLPLITSVTIFVLLGILLSKSIKKHATVYYIVLAIPFILVAIPFIGKMFGVEIFNFSSIPFLGGILRDYIHMGTFGFPLLIIIMYIGALNPKILWVKKLLVIRKELSIISGFPVLTHSLIRVANNFPNSLRFFTNNEEYMEKAKVVSELGAGISNFSFVLGIVLLVIFIPLWVTSFDSVHKRMGNVRWKKLQKWSYVLYALLFIHAMGIQLGGMLNPRGGGNTQRATVENVQKTVVKNTNEAHSVIDSIKVEDERSTINTERSERRNHGNAETIKDRGESRTESAKPNKEEAERGDRRSEENVKRNEPSDNEEIVQPESKRTSDQAEVANSKRSGRAQSFGFSDINVSSSVKRYIHISSLILIFGSYLYLRLRKAKKDAAKKKIRKEK